jgi:hypothetical protein
MENNRRIILDTSVLSMLQIQKYKSQGLTPYYFNREMGDNFGLVEFVKPLKVTQAIPKELFLMTKDEVEKINPLISNIKELIERSIKMTELCKEYIPAVINTLMNKEELIYLSYGKNGV